MNWTESLVAIAGGQGVRISEWPSGVYLADLDGGVVWQDGHPATEKELEYLADLDNYEIAEGVILPPPKLDRDAPMFGVRPTMT
jgi:hypothetical protein